MDELIIPSLDPGKRTVAERNRELSKRDDSRQTRYYTCVAKTGEKMLARDIMTRDPMFVLPSDPIWRAAEMMRYHGIGCTPVVADEETRKVVGLLTDRDIATRCVARKHTGACRVADHMTATPIHAVQTTDDASRVMRKMEVARVRRVPVLDTEGNLAGIISQGDVLRHMGRRDPVAFERAMEHVYAGSTFVR